MRDSFWNIRVTFRPFSVWIGMFWIIAAVAALVFFLGACDQPEKPPMTCADMAAAVCDSFDACGEPNQDCELIVSEICDEWPEPCQEEQYECSVIAEGNWWHCLRGETDAP